VKPQVDQEIWVAWLGATAMAGVSMTFVLLTYAYANFETKDRAKEVRDNMDKRLERIEMKLDTAIERMPARKN
jgi:hypothetical protein